MRAHIVLLGVAFLFAGVSEVPGFGGPVPQDVSAVFRDGWVIVEFSEQGRLQLESAIASLKGTLGVPAGFDEFDEHAVEQFVVAADQEDLVVKLSQCYFTLAIIFLKGGPAEADAYRRGKHWGLKALRADPLVAQAEARDGFLAAVAVATDVPALYWSCMNWLSVANFSPMEAVMGGIPTKTIAMLERVLELDETYDCYGAYRILGSVWGALPRLPFGTLRKDLERTRFYLCHVVESSEFCGDLGLCTVDPICEEYLGNRRVLAEYYLMEKGMWEDAARVLQSVLDAPIGSTYPLYNARAHEDAREMLERVKQHL